MKKGTLTFNLRLGPNSTAAPNLSWNTLSSTEDDDYLSKNPLLYIS